MITIPSSSSPAGHMAQPASQPERGAPAAPDTQATTTSIGEDHMWKPVARTVSRWVGAVRLATLEPVMLLDGACNQAMLIIMENVQMQKICSLKLGLSPEVCQNLSVYEEETIQVQQAFTRFSLYNSILMSLLPAFVGIFLGAWSDKYGRKIPLLVTLLAHVANAAGYLLNHYMTTWPLDILFIVTFLESIGGGNASFLSMGTCYTSDLSSLKSHTSRVSTNNSLWYLGGPLGTLICGLLIRNGNFAVPLMLTMMTYIGAVLYICFFIKETHGPFMHESFKRHDSPDDTKITKAEVTKTQMVKDFFQLRHVRDAYETVLKKREGNTRLILVAVVLSNMIRRVARGFFMYMFVRRALLWEADDYSYWMTYRSLVAALGSLSLVPTLSNWMSFSDSALALLGTVSIMLEYICYGLVNADRVFFMWLGPPLGILANANVIAIRSSATKLVRKEEKGHITAVMASTNGVMPLAAYGLYQVIYQETIQTFPSAQFFFATALNVLIIVAFMVIVFKTPSTKQDIDARGMEANRTTPSTAASNPCFQDDDQNKEKQKHSYIIENGAAVDENAYCTVTKRGVTEPNPKVVAIASVIISRTVNEKEGRGEDKRLSSYSSSNKEAQIKQSG